MIDQSIQINHYYLSIQIDEIYKSINQSINQNLIQKLFNSNRKSIVLILRKTKIFFLIFSSAFFVYLNLFTLFDDDDDEGI